MRVRVYQVLFVISALLFITGNLFGGLALFFIALGVLMFEFMPGRRGEEEKEEKIIKPLD